MEEQEIQFQLDCERSGISALFIAEEKTPGDVRIAVKGEDGEFRTPSKEETLAVEAHALSGRIRYDIILLAGDTFESWKPFADMLRSLTLTKAAGVPSRGEA